MQDDSKTKGKFVWHVSNSKNVPKKEKKSLMNDFFYY